MAIRINREQRDAIYAEIMDDLSGTGDIYIELGNGDYESAQRHRRRFEDDMRLLDDLGWDPEEPGEEFELSAPGDQLARALTSLNRNARATLHGHIVEPIEERAFAARSLIAQSAYSDVLAQLVDAPKEGAQPEVERP